MKRFSGRTICFPVVLLLSLIGRGYADVGDTILLPKDPKSFHIYLCMGQSNMVGTSYVEALDTGLVPRAYKGNMNDPVATLLWQKWYWTAQDIGHWGMCLVQPFAKYMTQQDTTILVGTINTAQGSTSINDWSKGSYLYSVSLSRAREAMVAGTLVGVLWHQGETDAHMTDWSTRVAKMIADFRADLGLPDLPWVLGEIMPNAADSALNAQVHVVATTVPNTDYASAEGLTSWAGDPCGGCHFSSASYRILGVRYAQKMLVLQAKVDKTGTRAFQREAASAMRSGEGSPAVKTARYDLRGREIAGAGTAKDHFHVLIVQRDGFAPVKMVVPERP